MNADEDQVPAGTPAESNSQAKSFFSQAFPRISLRRDTIDLLVRSGVTDSQPGVNEYCNQAIQHVIRSGEASRPNLDDLAALSAGINARSREMNLILLEIAQLLNDIAIVTEYAGVLEPLRDELMRE